MVEIKHIEIGPHFLTFYSTDLEGMKKLAKACYSTFTEELKDIQQKDFLHEENDPKVYHPYGEPGELFDSKTEGWRHFHVRFGRRPTDEDIEYMYNLIERHGGKVTNNVTIRTLGTRRVRDFEYPKPPRDKKEYLEYIQSIKDTDASI